MNLRQRLDELRTLAEKATPGPWEEKMFDDAVAIALPMNRDKDVFLTQTGEGVDELENMRLIAAMRNAIGPLLEVVEAQHVSLLELMAYFEKGEFLAGMEKRANAAISLMDKEES